MTYIVGSHWFICDVCGQKYRSTEKKKRWDGLVVCPADNEADHPQKYIRVDSDGQAVPDPRPRPEDVFALPVYCTPITRTAAADDGTADCMTVDYYLNINYRDYNAYQPIIPEAVVITPVLLDTFTAANGTDPTTRDIDNYPAFTGANRWQIRDVGFVAGEIVSNSLRTTSVVDQVSLVIQSDGGDVLADFSAGVTLLLWADALSDGFCRLWLENSSQNDGIKLTLNGEDLDVLVYGEVSGTYPEWEPAAALAVGSGLKKIAVHIGADNVGYLLLNGVQLASELLVTSGPWINQNWVSLRADVETNTSAYISRAALYQGLTLAQAIALTV